MIVLHVIYNQLFNLQSIASTDSAEEVSASLTIRSWRIH